MTASQSVTRKVSVECLTRGCEGMIWNINMGVCDDCFDSVVAVNRHILIPGYTGERKMSSDYLYSQRPH